MYRPMLTFLLVIAAAAAAAQPLDLEAIARQPGTEIVKRTENGAEVVEIRRGGVTVVIRDGQQVGTDTSRHGAVLCSWEMMVGLKAAADICFPQEFTEVSELLGEAIAAYDTFIVANSLTPVTKADLEARAEERARRLKAGGQACLNMRRDLLEPFAERLKTRSRAEVMRSVAEALSVPRPPVMNPCL